MARAFRFGVNMTTAGDRAGWVAKCRRAEQLGYDVILVPDHLGMPAPFPSLMLAAEATERPRLGTFVLNAGFFNPVLLSRDVNAFAGFTSGRFELGLGAGYVRAEFEQAGLQWPSARERVDHLVRTVEKVLEQREDDMPLMVGGNGDRVLRLAATRADIVAFAGLKSVPGDPPLAFLSPTELDERVAFVRAAAGPRDYESNLLLQGVLLTDDRRAKAEEMRRHHRMDLTVEQILHLPALLIGRPAEIAKQLLAARERYGFTYFVVLEAAMDDFAQVMSLVGAPGR